MQAALSALRIYVGLVWFVYGTSKFEPDWAGGKHEFLAAVRSVVPVTGEPFRSFVQAIVIPHQEIFAQLIAYGETLVGIALVLGLLSKVGAAGGVFLAANYYFTTGQYRLRLGIESLELMLVAVCLFLLIAPSNKTLALDAVITRRLRPRSS